MPFGRAASVALALLVLGCGGGGGGGSASPPTTNPPIGPTADITLLFLGNSHTAANDLPSMVAAMVSAARPGKSVAVTQAPGIMMLDERAGHPGTLELMENRTWTFVVLQAQPYSSSGQFVYPIDGAVSLVRKARSARATPIIFPEWPRNGIAETPRILDVYTSIARAEPACVAPVPQAWDLARARTPSLILHDADGNHSAPAGAFLAALAIATTMTGTSPDTLPFLPGLNVTEEMQARLRSAAAETVLAYAPRQFCPADPALPQ
ncbi:hypothetical protein [Usitatibacter palustris]|uniref:Uncharacterized protein n=1 Tax=Usitatibacter palustris TaxID=2732487 RepID=A0A6M4H986_9PROT|nr:hypothetical protein [Usitatibacter palustris]QJR14597.1 hypothetical protein DSM104440_01399 [Usitatibacter palustris]